MTQFQIIPYDEVIAEIKNTTNTIQLEVIVEGSALQRGYEIDYAISYLQQAKQIRSIEQSTEALEVANILDLAEEKWNQLTGS